MNQVKILHEKPTNILAIVEDLKKHGLVQNVDFSFSYFPAVYSEDEVIPRHTVFTFTKDSISSWFVLKYGI